MNDYKYTNMSKRDFINNIKIIRPWIEEPFEFEKTYTKNYLKDIPDLQEIGTYQSLHRYLIKIWEILNETKPIPI